MTNPDQPITGPIVACDNAIEYYSKQIRLALENLAKWQRLATEAETHLQTYREMLEQWHKAKQTLLGNYANSDGCDINAQT